MRCPPRRRSGRSFAGRVQHTGQVHAALRPSMALFKRGGLERARRSPGNSHAMPSAPLRAHAPLMRRTVNVQQDEGSTRADWASL